MPAYDPETGEINEYEVTATISHTDEDILHLYLDGELIETTAEHPFYTDDGTWINAADLSLGEQIRSLDGDYGTVELVIVVEDVYRSMYNLTVADVHTFVVGEGAWVVHNQDDTSQMEMFPRDPKLLPTELEIGSYGTMDGRKASSKLTPHHIPSNAYMLNSGLPYSHSTGLTILMAVSRHKRTYGSFSVPWASQATNGMTPYQALQHDLNELREIYKADGIDVGPGSDVDNAIKGYEHRIRKKYPGGEFDPPKTSNNQNGEC